MAIRANVIVQYDGEFLSDILLLTQAPNFYFCMVRWHYYQVLYSSVLCFVMFGGSACVYVCVFFPFILDIKFVGRSSRGHTGGRSHRIFHAPSFCGACLNFSREKDSAIPFPRRP